MKRREFIAALGGAAVTAVLLERRRIAELIPPARYASWRDASVASGSYDDVLVNEFRVARSANYRSDGTLLPSNLLYLTALGLKKPHISVVDFGGATGELGKEFQSVFPGSSFTVVENPTLVAMMRDKSSIQYVTSLPASCDIFFSSGTLQYVEMPLDVLAAGFSSAAYAVILTRNSFSKEKIYQSQTTRLFENGMGTLPVNFTDREISYPHQTLDEGEVMKIAERNSFRLVARVDESSGAFSYRKSVYGKELVFVRAG
jgi:putative methyltransferase (TIGR04325 family)